MALKDIKKDFSNMDKEELRAICRKGGQASARAYKKRKALREYLAMALTLKDDDGLDNYVKITKALIEEALAGDITGINSDISTIQAQLANLIPLTNSELDAMLNEVYK